MSDERRPYVRVYYDVIDDQKFRRVYPDDALFGRWVKLLMQADAVFPTPAAISRSTKARVLHLLEEDGIVELVGADHFRMVGLPAERARRAESAKNGGHVRAEQAARDDHGRFLPALDQPSATSAGGAGVASGGSPAASSAPAIDRARDRAEQEQETEQYAPGSDERDVLDTYHELTGYRPWGIWSGDKLRGLASEYGDAAVDDVLRGEWERSKDRATILDRLEARLAREADRAERARKAKVQPKRRMTPEEEAELDRQRIAIVEAASKVKSVPGGEAA